MQFAACANATLVEAIEEYATRVHVITAMKYGNREIMDQVIDHHWEIIRALEGTKGAALVDIVRRHLDLRRVEEYGQRYQMKYGSAETAPTTPRRRRIAI